MLGDSDQELFIFVPKPADMDMIDEEDISSDEDCIQPNPYLPVYFSSLSVRGKSNP